MKRTVSLLLCVLLLCGAVLSGCGGKDILEGKQASASNDKYRNFYQIFVHSFADSDGDRVGDLQGIIDHLDYLNDGDPNSGEDLGIDGIWLTPIMPSSSYHKYDVENYYDIDPAFGSLETFDKLLDECHKRGIKLIIDLVLNHISVRNPLFTNACTEVIDGKLDGDAQLFEIHEKDYFTDLNKTIPIGDYACEANFSPEMPEWNLSSEKTRAEFKKILEFWLGRGLDGFRLDALTYYTNKSTDGVEFLKWFVETARSINPDVYIVGENWTADSNIKDFYASGIDSQFAFKFSDASGTILEKIKTFKGNSLVSKVFAYQNKMAENNPDFINAMFLSNHDQMRIANALGSSGLDYEKFGASVYQLFPGNAFIYYGEEIGTRAPNNTGDANYRTAMDFDDENINKIKLDAIGTMGEDYETPPHGGVAQQLKDKDSLLNFYRRIIKVKLQNPEISRGKITGVEDFGKDEIGAFYTEYNGEKLMIIHNFAKEGKAELEITDSMLKNAVLAADLVGAEGESVSFSGGKLSLPYHCSVVLRTGEVA